MTLISLCATNYNSSPVTLRSLSSVLRHSEGLDREVVIVDNYSTDGSYEALSAYRTSVPISLVRHRCARGLGRQISFGMSHGDYIVVFDLDTIYNSNWGKLLQWVVANRPPFELEASLCQVYPRSLLLKVGGWRDLQFREDLDIDNRVAAMGLYRVYGMVCGENVKHLYSTDVVSRWLRLYVCYRDRIAIFTWIPLSLYLRGYSAWLGRNWRNSRDRSGLFYFSLFALAYPAGLRRRKILGITHRDFSALMDPSVSIDCGIVPRDELVREWGKDWTTAMCHESLSRGDFDFVFGTWE